MRNKRHRMGRTTARTAAARGAALCAGLLLCGTLTGAPKPHAAPGADPEEPTVNRREAELLQETAGVGATNAPAAAALLEKLDSAESSAGVDFAIGNLYFQAQQLEPAAAAYHRALVKHPEFTRAMMNLARVYIMQDQPDPAIALFRQLLVRGHTDADAYLLMGHALLLRDHAVSAENAYRQALFLDPDGRDARLGLTKCLLHQERYREALGIVSELLGIDADSSELWSLRANALVALDRTKEAMRALESARRLGRATGEMTATLGDLYLNADMPGEAVKCHQEASRKGNVSAGRTLRALEALVALRRFDEADALLPSVEERVANEGKEASELRPDLLRLKAQMARLRGDLEAAVRLCKELVRDNPLDGRALLLLGDLHRERGELEDALMTYERAAGVAGTEADALVRQAQAEVERERYARAVELLEASLVFENAPHVARYLDQVRRLVR